MAVIGDGGCLFIERHYEVGKGFICQGFGELGGILRPLESIVYCQ
jgi:hypothetical protein